MYFKQTVLQHPATIGRHSASTFDWDTVAWFLVFQETNDLPRNMHYPVTDRWVSQHCAQNASQKTFNWMELCEGKTDLARVCFWCSVPPDVMPLCVLFVAYPLSDWVGESSRQGRDVWLLRRWVAQLVFDTMTMRHQVGIPCVFTERQISFVGLGTSVTSDSFYFGRELIKFLQDWLSLSIGERYQIFDIWDKPKCIL